MEEDLYISIDHIFSSGKNEEGMNYIGLIDA